jgi:hypothetical protein
VFGLFLVRTIKQFDSRYVTGMVLSGAFLISVLFWTRRAGRRLATSDTAKKHAGEFLWSCIFFSMVSLGFGMAVTAVILYSADFMRTFNAGWNLPGPPRRDTPCRYSRANFWPNE